MLRKLVISSKFLQRKGLPVRSQSLLRTKNVEPTVKHKESSSSSNPSKVGKIIRKHVVVRRSTAKPKASADKQTHVAGLVKGLNALMQSEAASSSHRTEISAVVAQLRRYVPELANDLEGAPSKEQTEEASLFYNRVSEWNDEVAAIIDMSMFNAEPAMQSFYYVKKFRENFDFPGIKAGKIICSMDGVYHSLLRALAQEGRSIEAIKVLSWMRDDGQTPSFQSYTLVLEAMGHAESMSDFNAEVELIQQMRADGHALQDLLLVDDYSQDSLLNILRVVFRVEPTLKLNKKEVDTEANRYAHIPVLQRYRQTKVSRINPFHGVMTKKKSLQNLKRQIEAEQAGFTEIEPIAELRVNVSEEKRHFLREKLQVEREMWRGVLSIVLNDFLLRNSARRSVVVSALSILSLNECVDIMLDEIDYLVSESVTQYTHNYESHRRLGDRIYDAYLQKRRNKENHVDKIAAIYADYMPKILDDAERNPQLTNLADIWEGAAAPNLKGDSLNLKMPEWNSAICHRIGYQLHRLMYTHLKFDTKALSGLSKREEAPVIYESLEQQGDRLEKFIKIHPVLLRWFHLAGLPPLLFPACQLPMLCPPVPWVNPQRQNVAGFLFSQDYASKLIRSDVRKKGQRLGAYYLNDVRRREYSPVLDALNVLSSVAWRVNRPVLDAITHVFRSGGDRVLLRKLSIPVAPHDLPDPPPPPDPSLPFAARREAFQAMHAAQKERSQMFSLWYTELYRLSIANQFRDKTFWLPHSMDFRGRVYPCPPHFNYMGSDVSRSLLKFAKGRPLGTSGLDWLMIHLVNLTGLKKRASNKDRLSFAHTILADVLDSAERPLDGHGWWMQQEDPWQVLSCCMEIAEALKSADHRHFVSHFPVHQDGSCNGLQHYAALGRDALGADCVNLTPRDSPQDVYADVGELVEKQRMKDAAQGVAIAQQLEGYVKRKVIKQSVMTTVYGVTFYGAQLQIARQLREFDEFPPGLIREASAYLARLTLDSIGKIFTSSVKIQDWLVASARVITTQCGAQVAWKTPLGLTVMQPYTKAVGPRSFGSISRPDVAKQARAFPPNYVHSLDATHMALTALSCYRQGITFAAVHDCFWTHAADVAQLGAACRDQFVALHEQPLLQDLSGSLLRGFGSSLGQEAERTLRSVPKRGDLKIKTVLDSEYFFS